MTNYFPDILKVRNTEVSPPKLPLIMYREYFWEKVHIFYHNEKSIKKKSASKLAANENITETFSQEDWRYLCIYGLTQARDTVSQTSHDFQLK